MFTFLCMFDLASCSARKTRRAAVEAFHRAFPNPSSQALLIKISGADEHPEERAGAGRAASREGERLSHRPRLTRARANGLIAACDGVISLHRSEGFRSRAGGGDGAGKPVVADRLVGQHGLHQNGNSCPVAYELVTLDRSYRHYQAGAQWAEPDIDHAAHFLRRPRRRCRLSAELGERARHTIATQFGAEAAGLRYRRRLASLDLT